MNEQNQRILKDIMDRSENGTWEKMTHTDRVNVVMIMREYKKELDNFYRNEYYKVKLFSEIDINDLILESEEPDLSMFYKDNVNYQFDKLMGNY